ncbi:LptF/LptG family permease [Phenylobacterium sp.]|uniref:LptF/LptG family permease n=1 Tax=Phenylobacterium sp. TaxID=1871053 RepID=UPI002FDF9D20
MTGTMAAHILKTVGLRILAALLVLLGVLQVLDLLDVTTDIIERELGLAGVAYYALLRLPRLIEQAAPLAVLSGALFGFTKLARNSEVTAMRAAGMSAYRVTALAVPAAVLVMAVQLLMATVVAPRTDQTLTDWWRATTPSADQKAAEPRTFRLGADIVVATPASVGGERLTDLTIYHRNAEGRLTQTTRARSAIYRDGAWVLEAPTFRSVAPGRVQSSSAAEMIWRSDLTPGDVEALFAGSQISPGAAAAGLEGKAAVRPRSYYATQLQRFAADPLACVVMLLLAAPVALANFRSGGTALLVSCLAAGLVFLVVDGVFVAVGESGLAAAWLAAWAAPVLFSVGGLTALIYLEG